jgi:phage gp46-like protein
MPDLKIIINDAGFFDIDIDSNGDLATVDNFDTAILASLFVDKRADISEVPIPENRRGWWGDTVSDVVDDQNGSKLWLFDQARLTPIEQNKLEDEAFDACLWFVQDGYLDSINVNSVIRDLSILLTINFKIRNSVSESRAYELWLNTGTGRVI